MNGLKDFVEVECGGQNPLLQLKSHFSDEIHGDAATSFQIDSSHALPFSTAPNTFDMESLLKELKEADDQTMHHMPKSQIMPRDIMPIQDSSLALKWLDEIKDSSDVLHETNAFPNDRIQMDLPYFESPFFNYMDRLAPSWTSYQEAIFHQKTDEWLDGFLKDDHFDVSKLDNSREINDGAMLSDAKNRNEPLNMHENASESVTKEFWEMAEEEWTRIENMNGPSWARELQESYEVMDYAFEKENPVKDYPDVLQEGIRRLEIGDVSNAVLFLEAAVQKEPQNAEAWFYLGRSQADNEQECFAISAFEKCLTFDANNLKALTSLAVCYTNEGQSLKAIEMLFKWLKTNPRYSSLVKEDKNIPLDSITNYDDLVDLFLTAARNSPEDIDPDLQDAMGILFSLSSEYDKASDCFRTALQIRPEDSTLWNKLGATLANGNKSEEALEAYHRALSLRPGYVRTRFNLGVACYNLRAYRESVEHYLSALNLQKNSHKQTGTPSFAEPHVSETIWPSLKLSLTFLGATDLLPACAAHQLDILNKEFNVA